MFPTGNVQASSKPGPETSLPESGSCSKPQHHDRVRPGILMNSTFFRFQFPLFVYLAEIGYIQRALLWAARGKADKRQEDGARFIFEQKVKNLNEDSGRSSLEQGLPDRYIALKGAVPSEQIRMYLAGTSI